MVKSAQRSLVLSLHVTMGSEVHIGLLSVGGVVAPGKKNLSPENIADKVSFTYLNKTHLPFLLFGTKKRTSSVLIDQQCWELYKQPKESWEREMEIHE